MSKAYVDLHVHSALSPCGEEEMTPNNIVNMALIKELHMIAITDHNAIGNVLPAIKAAEGKSIVVVPGIELTSQEEVHLLAYFETYETLKMFYKEIQTALPGMDNRPHIFGRQLLFDENDTILGEDSRLLMNALQISFDRLVQMISHHGGVPVPAHVDRDSFSVYANLGFMPGNLPIKVVEVMRNHGRALTPAIQEELAAYCQIRSSDAHNLANILEQVFFIELEQISKESLFRWLKDPRQENAS